MFLSEKFVHCGLLIIIISYIIKDYDVGHIMLCE